MEWIMSFKSQKGGIILIIVAVLILILLVMSVQVPKKQWEEQAKRTEIARSRMLAMSDCEILYKQETGNFDKDLNKVYEFATNYNDLKMGAPDIDIEVLDMDSTSIRLSFTDITHFKDFNAVPEGQTLDNIETKDKYTAYLSGIGCPDAEVVMESDAAQIDELLKENPHKIFYRSLKEKFYKSSENTTEVLYNAGKNVSVDIQTRNPNLTLKSQTIKLTSTSDILAIANYKSKKDVFWDFVSKDKISVSLNKNEALEEQSVNMAQYVFSNIYEDTTPYLCPSTLEQFNVSYNLMATVSMNVTFFKNDTKDLANITKGKNVHKVTDNPFVQNYFLNIVKAKAERKVTELVREYEMDGDSTYSSEKAKSELFSKFFAEQLTEVVKEPLVDEVKDKTIESPDTESDVRFSEEERFKILFDANPGEQVAEEIKKEINAISLSQISCFYSTNIVKTETSSVKIESPINENSVFKGYTRGLFQNKMLFGIDDDENAGYVDDGEPSWKKD